MKNVPLFRFIINLAMHEAIRNKGAFIPIQGRKEPEFTCTELESPVRKSRMPQSKHVLRRLNRGRRH